DLVSDLQQRHSWRPDSHGTAQRDARPWPVARSCRPGAACARPVLASLEGVVIAGILGRYISRTVLLWVLIVAILLVGLYTLIEAVRQAQDMTGDYGAMQVLAFIIQTTPS